jgi:hypothetical protein
MARVSFYIILKVKNILYIEYNSPKNWSHSKPFRHAAFADHINTTNGYP